MNIGINRRFLARYAVATRCRESRIIVCKYKERCLLTLCNILEVFFAWIFEGF